MKKVATIAAAILASSSAYAEFSGQVGLGYQTSNVDTNYGECWEECFGDDEPSGFALEAEFNFDYGLFLTLDVADTEDNEDVYDGPEITREWKDTSIGFGYSLVINDSANVTFALVNSDVEWAYTWEDGGEWIYSAEDSGVSVVVGADTMVTDKVEAGVALSLGFAEGIEAYTQYALTDNAYVKAAYITKGYELGEFEYDQNGTPSDPADDNGDGDYEIDTQVFRISAGYTF